MLEQFSFVFIVRIYNYFPKIIKIILITITFGNTRIKGKNSALHSPRNWTTAKPRDDGVYILYIRNEIPDICPAYSLSLVIYYYFKITILMISIVAPSPAIMTNYRAPR